MNTCENCRRVTVQKHGDMCQACIRHVNSWQSRRHGVARWLSKEAYYCIMCYYFKRNPYLDYSEEKPRIRRAIMSDHGGAWLEMQLSNFRNY